MLTRGDTALDGSFLSEANSPAFTPALSGNCGVCKCEPASARNSFGAFTQQSAACAGCWVEAIRQYGG